MPEWLQQFVPEGWDSREVLFVTAGFTIATAVISLAMVAWVVVRLPGDYFVSDRAANRWKESHPLIRWPMTILSQLLGIVLILLGIVMSLPGVPGQGFLTIMVGIMLLEFPGKRNVERWVLRRRGVSLGINKIRARFGREPLQLDNPAATP
ncbi:hypothetical protein [Zavarzinella formosa]|uniref:hypothetical protein n=1 Tax=Zavarzinella formosa TaxID=360055 RepID=UPI0002E626B3|nr:hypothetical protein [Zavarzinella formosa]